MKRRKVEFDALPLKRPLPRHRRLPLEPLEPGKEPDPQYQPIHRRYPADQLLLVALNHVQSGADRQAYHGVSSLPTSSVKLLVGDRPPPRDLSQHRMALEGGSCLAQLSAPEGAAGAGRNSGPWSPVHRSRVRAGEAAHNHRAYYCLTSWSLVPAARARTRARPAETQKRPHTRVAGEGCRPKCDNLPRITAV